jgi:hypothetical protein
VRADVAARACVAARAGVAARACIAALADILTGTGVAVRVGIPVPTGTITRAGVAAQARAVLVILRVLFRFAPANCRCASGRRWSATVGSRPALVGC